MLKKISAIKPAFNVVASVMMSHRIVSDAVSFPEAKARASAMGWNARKAIAGPKNQSYHCKQVPQVQPCLFAVILGQKGEKIGMIDLPTVTRMP